MPSWAIAAGLTALIAFVYWRVGGFGFAALDDSAYVQQNPQVQAGLTAASVWWAWTSGYASNWHPLTWMSHQLDVTLFGMDPGWHHVTNAVLHAASTILLFFVLKRMTREIWPSAFVAALFGVHPLHVESVAWIAERKDVLSGLFWMLTLWAYVNYVDAPASRGRSRSVLVLIYAAGLAAKPMLVTLPFVLLLLDWWPLGRVIGAPAALARTATTWRALILEKVPLFALAAASSVVTVVAQHASGAMRGTEVLAFNLRLGNAIESLVLYLRSAVWPVGLSTFYTLPAGVSGLAVTSAALVVLAFSAFAVSLPDDGLSSPRAGSGI